MGPQPLNREEKTMNWIAEKAKKQIIASLAFLLIAIFASSTANGAQSSCPDQYFQGQSPDFVNERLAQSVKELCNSGYATMYSGISRTPLWSAEFLTPGRIEAAKGQPRTEDFRVDLRLPKDFRSTPDDFKRSGKDKGHLAPSADFASPAAVSESFLMSNMIPQDPNLNRNLWSALESAVRSQAAYQPIYVITGALFIGSELQRMKGRVLVPTHVYKLLYDPKQNAAAAYLVENAPDKRHREVSLAELEEIAGVKFLPAAKNVAKLKLPRPRYR